MDVRDYFVMVRRGWPVVVVSAVLFVGAAVGYLAVTPKRYESTVSLVVSANAPASIVDLAQGNQFLLNSVAGYAQVIDSVTVLGPVAASLRPQQSVDQLIGSVSATVRPLSTFIDVTASGSDPKVLAAVADAAAAGAARVIPGLAQSAAGQPLVRVQQLSTASTPGGPVSPNSKRILVLGLLVGLLIGLAATIARQSLDTRIRRVQDLRGLTDLPVLAVLPRPRRGQLVNRPARGGSDVDVADPVAAGGEFVDVGEGFRGLRTNIRFLDAEQRRSVVLTGVADELDGPHVPVNLALALAQAGHRVLLVDADLRRTAVAEALALPAGAGLSDFLAGQIQLPELAVATGHNNLWVVRSGSTVPNPSELLSSSMMTSTLRWMESAYDYVLFHTPPLLTYTDAAVLSAAAGGTLVTVTVGHTRAQQLGTALTVLANIGVTPLGTILTRAASTTNQAPMPPIIAGATSIHTNNGRARLNTLARQRVRLNRSSANRRTDVRLDERLRSHLPSDRIVHSEGSAQGKR